MVPIDRVIMMLSWTLSHFRRPQARHGTITPSLSPPCPLTFHPACTCEIVVDDGEVICGNLIVLTGAGRQQVKVKMTNFQHPLITIALIAAAISVEDWRSERCCRRYCIERQKVNEEAEACDAEISKSASACNWTPHFGRVTSPTHQTWRPFRMGWARGSRE